MTQKKHLTSTNGSLTLLGVLGNEEGMDPTTRKLFNQLRELERESWRIREKVRAIHMALNLAGVRPPVSDLLSSPDPKEMDYAAKLPFADTLLSEACQQVLKDYRDKWLTKSQVEWLVARGGYKSSAKDPKNSVDMALRRLAGDGKCEVERVRGSRGNRYRWISRFPRNAKDKPEAVAS